MAKQVRPADFKGIAYDGLVRVDYGSWLVIGEDAFPEQSAEFHRERIARIRGDFLGGGFLIDNELVLILLLDQFGTLEAATGGTPFDDLETSFRKKTLGQLMHLANPIALRLFEGPEREAWSGETAELLQVRNALAHQTFWLHPVNDPDAGTIPGSPFLRTTSFVPMIADRDAIWTVDDEQVTYWNALRNSVLTRARQLRAKLPLAEPSETPAAPDNRPPLGIFIPNGRPIPNPESKLIMFYHGADDPDLRRVPGPKMKERIWQRLTVDPHVETRLGTDSAGNPPPEPGNQG
ncbi:hypothetical protein E5673_08375 [Sphingomonas sp. PAMC26645]|uniref:hypothetical protein n=1 Tax=Sphingomonas sp. PAMC26645 TaxID=2565555 RepID=UPI00109DBA12|nr:hypothetical protein [Sphingomonas sp. PAMC26645]QCB42247.1 hypothetical protein E5673_08375 [Sphingomonas sp. PAMC26645]